MFAITSTGRLHALVVLANVGVVEAPRGLQTILGVRELGLQGEEVLVRLQIRVGLGDGEELAERGDEGPSAAAWASGDPVAAVATALAL